MGAVATLLGGTAALDVHLQGLGAVVSLTRVLTWLLVVP